MLCASIALIATTSLIGTQANAEDSPQDTINCIAELSKSDSVGNMTAPLVKSARYGRHFYKAEIENIRYEVFPEQGSNVTGGIYVMVNGSTIHESISIDGPLALDHLSQLNLSVSIGVATLKCGS
jgi:hypothetical protein